MAGSNGTGSRFLTIRGISEKFITGFSYSVPIIPVSTENLGIRLAEGVAGDGKRIGRWGVGGIQV